MISMVHFRSGDVTQARVGLGRDGRRKKDQPPGADGCLVMIPRLQISVNIYHSYSSALLPRPSIHACHHSSSSSIREAYE